ncbi:unnamed protein product [Rhodiola kirilowii]
MLSTTIDWSQQPQMNGATENPTRPMSSFQIRSTDGRKLGSATAADQQAAAAAAPLKCPRCDSSNTKFCYYNNYSLSQPRHFCKACKRYWTRGGMLRNVPVGGGCRKSKQRVRQPSIKLPPSGQRSSNNISHENGPDQTARSQGQNQIEESNLGLNGLLYGKNSATMEICNGFGASRVTDMDLGARVNSSSSYNQITNLGLGFSSGDYMRNQYDNSSYPFSFSNLFSSNLSSPAGVSSVPPLMRSMLGNNGFEQEKFVNELSSSSKEHFGHFLSALPLEDMHIGGSGRGHGHPGFGRGMKVEELGQMNKFNQMGSLSSTSIDPSLQNWINGASNMNTWSEVPNIGSSSVMSLL